MTNGTHLVRLGLSLGLLLTMCGCSKKTKPPEVQDMNAVRAELREQVDRGKLSREEAVVRLAEATKEAKFGSKKKGEGKQKELSPELEALGKDLKEQMKKGELTEEEAKKAWFEAAGKTKSKPKSQGTKDSTKGKE